MNEETIHSLEKRLKQTQSFIDDIDVVLSKNPDDFASSLEKNSFQSHLDDINKQLIILRASAEHELLEMRLHGAQVARGSIPLSMLAKLAEPLQKSISHAVFNIAGGNKISKISSKIKKESLLSITRDLDLRLVAIGAGSTRLYITGNSKPDLTDTTYLPQAIESIINMLNSDEDNFYDMAHYIGSKSAMQIKEVIETLEKEFASVDLSWRAPDNSLLQWNGRRGDIIKIKELLDRIAEPENSNLTISGEVVLLAKTGRLEMVSEGVKYKIKYPARLFKDVSAKMRIGQNSRVELAVQTYIDTVKQESINLYNLNDILG